MNMNEMEIKDKFLRGNRFKMSLAWVVTVALVIFTIVFSFRFFREDVRGRDGWVIDNDRILRQTTIDEINAMNRALRESGRDAEILVVVERDSRANRNLPRRAENLFSTHSVSENGLLLIMAVPDSSTGIGSLISGIVDDVMGGRYDYAYAAGRGIPRSLDERITGEFASAFVAYYDAGNYDAAILSMFGNIFNYSHFGGGGLAAAPVVPQAPQTHAAGMSFVYDYSRFLSPAAVIILVFFIVMILGRRRRVRAPFRVYRSPRWFGGGRRGGMSGFGGLGLGLGMGMGMSRMMSGRNNRRAPRSGGLGGGSFRSGGSGRGGGFGGGSSSPRSGGSFRSGGSSGRSGGGFRGGGSSRGGGRRR